MPGSLGMGMEGMARPGKPGRAGIGIEGSAGRLGNVRLMPGSLGMGIGGNAHKLMVVGSPICFYAFYAVSHFLKEKVTMYAEWKKALEEFQESECVFQKELEELRKMFKMIEAVSSTVPALVHAYAINLERVKEFVFAMRKILKKMEESKELDAEEQTQIVCFLAERKKLYDLKSVLYQQLEKANRELQGMCSK